MNKHCNTAKHINKVKLNMIRNDICNDDIIRFFIKDGDQYSLDNQTWQNLKWEY